MFVYLPFSSALTVPYILISLCSHFLVLHGDYICLNHCIAIFSFVLCLSSFVLVKELDSPNVDLTSWVISTYFPSSFRFSLYACYYTSTVISIITIGPISTVKLITSLYDDPLLLSQQHITLVRLVSIIQNTNRYLGCASPTR